MKAIKRNIIGESRFNTEINLYEDEIFSLNVLVIPCKVASLQKALYYYVVNNESLSFKTYQNYCILCDNVYKSWKQLFITIDTELLNKKANHYYKICKYYGLERKVDIVAFFKEMQRTAFFSDCSVKDELYNRIQSGKFYSIYLYAIVLRFKTRIYRIKTLLNK